MLFLWVFGGKVEDSMGHSRFLVFYLLCGVAAAIAQAIMNPGSTLPMVGASGAISGVLGAYFLLYPLATIRVLFLLGFIPIVARSRFNLPGALVCHTNPKRNPFRPERARRSSLGACRGIRCGHGSHTRLEAKLSQAASAAPLTGFPDRAQARSLGVIRFQFRFRFQPSGVRA